MNHGLSDQVRMQAKIGHVAPAIGQGKRRFSISVKDLLRELEAEGFPANHARQVCMALSSGKFLRESSIEIEGIDGPPSKTSTTVVFHYRVTSPSSPVVGGPNQQEGLQMETKQETPEEWAHRVTGKLHGLLKDELAEYGGGEGFIRWVRGYDEEN